MTILLALCSFFVFTPKMLGILVGMDQKDSYAGSRFISTAPCLSQSLVGVHPWCTRVRIFLGDHSQKRFRSQRCLVRQWIRVCISRGVSAHVLGQGCLARRYATTGADVETVQKTVGSPQLVLLLDKVVDVPLLATSW